jgi:hypothetical protein
MLYCGGWCKLDGLQRKSLKAKLAMKMVNNIGRLLADFFGWHHSGEYRRINFFRVVLEESRTRGLG